MIKIYKNILHILNKTIKNKYVLLRLFEYHHIYTVSSDHKQSKNLKNY